MQDKVFIKNKKGLKLAAIVDSPESDEKYPGVILLHGFKGYKEEDTYAGLANSFVSAIFTIANKRLIKGVSATALT